MPSILVNYSRGTFLLNQNDSSHRNSRWNVGLPFKVSHCLQTLFTRPPRSSMLLFHIGQANTSNLMQQLPVSERPSPFALLESPQPHNFISNISLALNGYTLHSMNLEICQEIWYIAISWHKEKEDPYFHCPPSSSHRQHQPSLCFFKDSVFLEYASLSAFNTLCTQKKVLRYFKCRHYPHKWINCSMWQENSVFISIEF